MPKVNGLFQDNKTEIIKWIKVGLIEKDMNQKELAERTRIPASTFQYKMADPGKFRLLDIWSIERVIGPFRKE